jgi:hypothetical protein
VQAANTYWSTAVWCGGFGALLQQEIVNIGGASNIGALSPAICPARPTGSYADDALTQEQLFVRMDLMCAQGITDESGFTFFEIAQGPQGNAALGERYFEVFSYFSAPARSAGLPDIRVMCAVCVGNTFYKYKTTLYHELYLFAL